MAKKKKLTDEQKDFVLGKLMQYREEGIRKRDEGRADRQKARDVWDGVFSGSPPADSLYFPKVYALLRHWVRSIRKVYSRPEHIVNVHPEGLHASDWEVYVAKKQREELLYVLHQWNDMKSFIDDTATQGTVNGSMCSKVRWVREEFEVFEDQTQLKFADDGEIVEETVKVKTAVKQLHNYPKIEWVDREKILWEDGRSIWADVRWTMQIEMEATEAEMYDMVAQGDFDEDLVDAFFNDIREKNKANNNNDTSSRPVESQKFMYMEFWGWMQYEEGEDPEFVKVYATDGGGSSVISENQLSGAVTNGTPSYLLSYPDRNVYRHLTGKPMNPFEVHYLLKKEGEIEGESACLRARHIQGEINCIRNQRRRSIENDLNYKFFVDRNKDVQFTKLAEGTPGMLIESNGLDGVREIAHRDNTQSSYGELDYAQKDLEELTGVNPLVLGMPDPHLADTAFGINLMSNNANTNIFDVVESYNTFFERNLTKMLELSVQYTDLEQLESSGFEIGRDYDISREDMKQPVRIRIDAGIGATSEMVEINNKTKAYFMIQQLNKNLLEMGVEIGPMRYIPAELYKEILPLLGVKNMERYIPSPRELEAWTKRTLDMKMEMMKRKQAVGLAGARQERVNQVRQGFQDGQQQVQANAGVANG